MGSDSRRPEFAYPIAPKWGGLGHGCADASVSLEEYRHVMRDNGLLSAWRRKNRKMRGEGSRPLQKFGVRRAEGRALPVRVIRRLDLSATPSRNVRRLGTRCDDHKATEMASRSSSTARRRFITGARPIDDVITSTAKMETGAKSERPSRRPSCRDGHPGFQAGSRSRREKLGSQHVPYLRARVSWLQGPRENWSARSRRRSFTFPRRT